MLELSLGIGFWRKKLGCNFPQMEEEADGKRIVPLQWQWFIRIPCDPRLTIRFWENQQASQMSALMEFALAFLAHSRAEHFLGIFMSKQASCLSHNTAVLTYFEKIIHKVTLLKSTE